MTTDNSDIISANKLEMSILLNEGSSDVVIFDTLDMPTLAANDAEMPEEVSLLWDTDDGFDLPIGDTVYVDANGDFTVWAL